MVRLAADLNQEYYELQQKRQKLESRGLLDRLEDGQKRDIGGFRGDTQKTVKPRELFDEALLSNYNQVAQKVWEERLIKGVMPGKDAPKKHNEQPTNVNLFELDGWRTNEAAALDLLKKYKPDSDVLNQNRPDELPLARLGNEKLPDRPKEDASSGTKKPPIATLSDKSGAGRSDPAENLLNKLRGGPSVESMKQAQSPHGSEDLMGSGAKINKQSAKSLQPTPRPVPEDNPAQKRGKFSNMHEMREEPAEIVEESLKQDLPERIAKPADYDGIGQNRPADGQQNNARPKSARGGPGGIIFTEPVPKPKLLGQDSLIDSASGLHDFSMALKDKSGFGSGGPVPPAKDPAPAQPPVEEISGGAYSMFSASGSGNAKGLGTSNEKQQGMSRHHAAAQAQRNERIDETPPSADEFEDEFLISKGENPQRDSHMLELSRSNLPNLGQSIDKSKATVPKKSGLEDLDLDDFEDF